MAAKKTAATPKTKPENTSAPTAGELAEVSVTGAGQPAPQTVTESATPATPVVDMTEPSPNGGESTAAEEKAVSGGVVTRLIVSAMAEGFRRAGRAWSKNAETVSAEDFTDAQIEALLAEPMLDVTAVVE